MQSDLIRNLNLIEVEFLHNHGNHVKGVQIIHSPLTKIIGQSDKDTLACGGSQNKRLHRNPRLQLSVLHILGMYVHQRRRIVKRTGMMIGKSAEPGVINESGRHSCFRSYDINGTYRIDAELPFRRVLRTNTGELSMVFNILPATRSFTFQVVGKQLQRTVNNRIQAIGSIVNSNQSPRPGSGTVGRRVERVKLVKERTVFHSAQGLDFELEMLGNTSRLRVAPAGFLGIGFQQPFRPINGFHMTFLVGTYHEAKLDTIIFIRLH